MKERMTTAELHALQQKPANEDKRRVRGTKRIEVDGEWFDSTTEAKRYQELLLLQKAGKISGLRRQVKIPLEGRDGPIMTDGGKRRRTWAADFVYIDHAAGVQVIEDRKGHATDKFNLIKCVLAAMGIEVLVT